MANKEIYFIKLAAWLARALGQGSSFAADLDTDAFGTRLPESIINHPNVQAAGQAVVQAGQALSDASGELESAAASGDEAQLIAALLKIGENIIRLYNALDLLVGEIEYQIDTNTQLDPGEFSAAKSFMLDLTRKISDYLIITVIEYTKPRLALLLKLLGLIEWTCVPADSSNPLSQPYVKKGLNLQAFKNLIQNPGQHLIDTIGWGSNSFDPTDFFLIIESFYEEEDDITVGEVDGDPYIQRGIFRLRRDSSQSPPGLKLEITATLEQSANARINVSEFWGVGVDTSLKFTGGISAGISPPLSLSLMAETVEASGEFRLYVNRNEEARPFDIVGGNSLITLSAEDTSIGVGLDASVDVVSGQASLQPLVFSELKGLTLRIGSEDADGFLADILAGAKIEGRFDLGLEWHAEKGLVIKASGGIEIALPIHKSLGFIEFKTLYLSLKIKSDGTLELEISTALSAMLGPLSASVDRMGVLLGLRFDEGSSSKFGFFDLDLGFKPPNGVGLAVEAANVKGGGYLSFDFEKEQYTGVLELVFSDFLTLKAIGLITTKMPDGSKGFSLLIIITAEFGSTGYQLGYGFTLLGVGGLLGLNRTIKLQPLTEGVRSGAVNRIMFPTDIIKNAQRIISDLRTFFPPEEGKFLIGPMAKLGWGTPTLLSLSLGIIIEIPGNIAIVGVLKVILPDEKAALLKLQVNFIGAIEFDKKRAYFFAALFESRVLFMTIEGEMGVLVAWGDDSNFVVSVGGFHPQFNPPPLPFPTPKRVAINILNKSNARIKVSGYFAVTSNTAQFGAHAELYFGFSACNVQGNIGFDALFYFSPFRFIIEISGSLSLKVFGVGLLSISLNFSLEGPADWRAKGSGSIRILFIPIKVNFDITWGEKKETTLPDIDVMPILTSEFEKLENWTAELTGANNLLVSLRNLDTAPGDLVLHPVGFLRITQRAVPLNLPIDKVGNQKPGDAKKFTIDVNTGGLGKKGETRESFAMAQFQEMEGADKLTRPAYEPQLAGLELSVEGQQLASSKMVKRVVRYETIIIDTNFKRFVQRFFLFMGSLFSHFFKGSAVTKSVLSQNYKKQMQPFDEKIWVKPDLYAVTFNSDNTVFSREAAEFGSEAMAREYMRQQVDVDPTLAGLLHVIPQYEVNRAA